MWLWIGSAILTLGGVLSIADRGRRSLTARKPADTAETVQEASA